jgi:hypothetical protein
MMPSEIVLEGCVFYLLRFCKVEMYSRVQRAQKCCRSCSIRCHRDRRLSGTGRRLASTGAVSDSPTSKCPGVSTSKSKGSFDIGVIGRELKHASMRVRRVYISSYVTKETPRIFLRWLLTNLTPDSQIPPIGGLLGGMKCQDIF